MTFLTQAIREISQTYAGQSLELDNIPKLHQFLNTHQQNMQKLRERLEATLYLTEFTLESEPADLLTQDPRHLADAKSSATICTFDSETFYELYWAFGMLQMSNQTVYRILTHLKSLNPVFVQCISLYERIEFLESLMVGNTDFEVEREHLRFIIRYLLDGTPANPEQSTDPNLLELIQSICAAATYADYKFSVDEIKLFICGISNCGVRLSFEQLTECVAQGQIDVSEALIDFYIANGVDTSDIDIIFTKLCGMFCNEKTNKAHTELLLRLCRKNLMPSRKVVLDLLFSQNVRLHLSRQSAIMKTSHDERRQDLLTVIQLLMQSIKDIHSDFVTYELILGNLIKNQKTSVLTFLKNTDCLLELQTELSLSDSVFNDFVTALKNHVLNVGMYDDNEAVLLDNLHQFLVDTLQDKKLNSDQIV